MGSTNSFSRPLFLSAVCYTLIFQDLPNCHRVERHLSNLQTIPCLSFLRRSSTHQFWTALCLQLLALSLPLFVALPAITDFLCVALLTAWWLHYSSSFLPNLPVFGSAISTQPNSCFLQVDSVALMLFSLSVEQVSTIHCEYSPRGRARFMSPS